MHWKGCGEPTQALYHIPAPVLKPKGNLVVLFEETASVDGTGVTVAQGSQGRQLHKVELVALTAHPQ